MHQGRGQGWDSDQRTGKCSRGQGQGDGTRQGPGDGTGTKGQDRDKGLGTSGTGWGSRDGDTHQGRGQGWDRDQGTRTKDKDTNQSRGLGPEDRDVPLGQEQGQDTRREVKGQGWDKGGHEAGGGTRSSTGGDTRQGVAALGVPQDQGEGPPAHLGVRAEHVEPQDGSPGTGELVVVGNDDKGQRGGLGRGQRSGWLSPKPPKPL